MNYPEINGGNGDAIVAWAASNVQNPQFEQLQPPLKKPRSSEDDLQPRVNRGTNNIFYKTRMCAKFKMGTCRNGEHCNFAHGIEDLRQPPPNWPELIGLRDDDHRRMPGNWEEDQKIIQRMKLCKRFYNGEECPYGDKCSFLHEDPAKFRDESKRFRESSAISIRPSGPVMMPGGGGNVVVAAGEGSRSNGSFGAEGFRVNNNNNVKPVYWKTKLCTKWELTGHCPFGEKCHFAHGQAELQVPFGRADVETGNAAAVLGKPHSVQAIDAAPSQTAIRPVNAVNEDGQGKKSLLKWKGGKKLDRIYADWLDDMPLILPNKADS